MEKPQKKLRDKTDKLFKMVTGKSSKPDDREDGREAFDELLKRAAKPKK